MRLIADEDKITDLFYSPSKIYYAIGGYFTVASLAIISSLYVVTMSNTLRRSHYYQTVAKSHTRKVLYAARHNKVSMEPCSPK